MENKTLIIDGHLDLAMNAMEWNRDLRWTVDEIRKSEAGITDKPDRAKGTVSLPSMREGNIGICIATQIGRYVKPGNSLPGWNSPEQAWAQTQGQLAWYKAMEEACEMVQICNCHELEKHLLSWETNPLNSPIGYIMIDNIDYICQLAGNSLHAGIGSDLDGAFGKEQCPYDLDTIADLQKIPAMLSDIGFKDLDINNVMSGNWIRFLKKNLNK
jgi:hypothetical protein